MYGVPFSLKRRASWIWLQIFILCMSRSKQNIWQAINDDFQASSTLKSIRKAIFRTEKLSIEQKSYWKNRKAIDRTEKLSIEQKTPIFVAKTRNYDIFVAKIYDYALIDSFWGFPRFIDSPTSYATLVHSEGHHEATDSLYVCPKYPTCSDCDPTSKFTLLNTTPWRDNTQEPELQGKVPNNGRY